MIITKRAITIELNSPAEIRGLLLMVKHFNATYPVTGVLYDSDQETDQAANDLVQHFTVELSD